MAKKKVAPSMASAPAESKASPPADSTASAPADSTAPHAESTASALDKNKAPALDRNKAPALDRNAMPSSSNKNEASSPSKNAAPSSSKNAAPSSSKNAAPSSSKNKAPVPAKDKAPIASKDKASLSTKNTESAPDKSTASSPDKNAAPKWWRGLLDAFVPQGHLGGVSDSGGVERSAEKEETVVKDAPTEGSTSIDEEEALTEGSSNQEQRKKREENQSWLYAKPKKTQQQDEKESLTEDSTNQEQREENQSSYHRNKTKKQDEVLPPPLMVDNEVVTPDLVERYADYCRYKLACPWGKTVCQVCVIEDQKDIGYRFLNSKMIFHCKDKHQILSGLVCKERDCRVIVRTPRDLALHAYFCHGLDSGAGRR